MKQQYIKDLLFALPLVMMLGIGAAGAPSLDMSVARVDRPAVDGRSARSLMVEGLFAELGPWPDGAPLP